MGVKKENLLTGDYWSLNVGQDPSSGFITKVDKNWLIDRFSFFSSIKLGLQYNLKFFCYLWVGCLWADRRVCGCWTKAPTGYGSKLVSSGSKLVSSRSKLVSSGSKLVSSGGNQFCSGIINRVVYDEALNNVEDWRMKKKNLNT